MFWGSSSDNTKTAAEFISEYLEMNDVESPNVYRRTKYLYEQYKKDNAADTGNWGTMEDKDEGTKRSDKKASVISSLNQKAKRDLGYQRWRMSSAS